MLVSKILEDIAAVELDLIEYCKSLTNTVPVDLKDADAYIHRYLMILAGSELLKLANSRGIEVGNSTLVAVLVQEINSGEMSDSKIHTSYVLEYIVEMLNATTDLADLKIKISEMSESDIKIASCFC